MKSKRFLCLLLVLLMVFSLTPSETRAETTVYFTAVNDQLLPDLSDETMPFWSGGRLYVPSTVITGTDLGLFYSRSRDKSTAVVYRQGSALTFNFAAGTVADQNDRQYSGPAIVRSDVVFLPLDLLTQFFSLDYSYTRVTYGYLVRVKSDMVVLSDAKFIDAAAMSMEQRYNEYMKTHSESNDPGNTPDQNTDGDRDLVCLALRVTDEESANALLDTLASNNATATFLFSEEQLSSLGDLLRRVVISGNAAALRIDASGGAIFFAAGVFYYFLREQVRALVQRMAAAFPGGVLVFDAANRTAVKMIAKTWLRTAKIKDVGAYFAVSDAERELSPWDSRLQVSSRGYMLGYNDLKDPSVSGFFRFLAKVGDNGMKMQIVKIGFGGKL